jgi:hypothetical protein
VSLIKKLARCSPVFGFVLGLFGFDWLRFSLFWLRFGPFSGFWRSGPLIPKALLASPWDILMGGWQRLGQRVA